MQRVLAALAFAAVALATLAGSERTRPTPSAQSDLDDFMRQVVAHRDENWKKLQQYILDERESFELRGPTRLPIFGQRREYTWFIREGLFVRSPVKFNGVTIADDERRKFERDYLERQKKRDLRARGLSAEPPADESDASDVGGLLRQTREPEFVSSAYFLRFKFEEGNYALVGRETLDGREVLRVEHFPREMFAPNNRRRNGNNDKESEKDRAKSLALQKLMNKVALITLWVEPKAHQIIQYTFDNVGFDFLPVSWLLHVSDAKATMKMTQPFPDVWLPDSLEVNVALMIATGQYDLRYALDYHDYRQPDVSTKVGIKEK
jgi:hypothetical protein